MVGVDGVVDAAEAARELRVSARTMRRYLRDGFVKGFKVGPRLWRVPSSELRRLTSR
jgi:excisionase family DNA binding protein